MNSVASIASWLLCAVVVNNIISQLLQDFIRKQTKKSKNHLNTFKNTGYFQYKLFVQGVMRPATTEVTRIFGIVPEKIVVPKQKQKKCNYQVSNFHGTFLGRAHLQHWKIILFVNH